MAAKNNSLFVDSEDVAFPPLDRNGGGKGTTTAGNTTTVQMSEGIPTIYHHCDTEANSVSEILGFHKFRDDHLGLTSAERWIYFGTPHLRGSLPGYRFQPCPLHHLDQLDVLAHAGLITIDSYRMRDLQIWKIANGSLVQIARLTTSLQRQEKCLIQTLLLNRCEPRQRYHPLVRGMILPLASADKISMAYARNFGEVGRFA